MQEKITIHQLVGKLVAEMKRAGFTDTTIWHCYMPRVGSIEHYYEKLGQVYYDPMVTDEYVRLQRERVKRGEIATYSFLAESCCQRICAAPAGACRAISESSAYQQRIQILLL